MSLLILAFEGTITEQIAGQLHAPADKVYLQSDQDWLEHMITTTVFTKYDYILAMGEYNGRGKKAIRIETECTSQFRNQKEDLRKLVMPYFFKPAPPFKLAKGIGNSWCNLIAYQLLSNTPDVKFTFLHIPKSFGAGLATKAIEQQLTGL